MLIQFDVDRSADNTKCILLLTDQLSSSFVGPEHRNLVPCLWKMFLSSGPTITCCPHTQVNDRKLAIIIYISY